MYLFINAFVKLRTGYLVVHFITLIQNHLLCPNQNKKQGISHAYVQAIEIALRLPRYARNDKKTISRQEEIDFFNEESEMYDDIGYTINWYEYYEEKIILNSNHILSFERYLGSYTGGAHGSHIYDLINFDLHTGDTIFLDDILIDGYEADLNDIADIIFRKDNDIVADEDLSEIGYWGLDDGFRVNNNFLLTMNGLRFIFNEYEIAPYAAGAIELFIPYKRIKHLIRSGSLVESLVQ